MTNKELGLRQRPEPESNPEAGASVRAFPKRMMPNHPLLGNPAKIGS